MGWATAAYAAIAIGSGAYASDRQKAQAEKGKKHSKYETIAAEQRIFTKQKQLRDTAKDLKRERSASIERNKTLFVDPLGLQNKADVVRKSLTGQ